MHNKRSKRCRVKDYQNKQSCLLSLKSSAQVSLIQREAVK